MNVVCELLGLHRGRREWVVGEVGGRGLFCVYSCLYPLLTIAREKWGVVCLLSCLILRWIDRWLMGRRKGRRRLRRDGGVWVGEDGSGWIGGDRNNSIADRFMYMNDRFLMRSHRMPFMLS